MKCIYKIPLNKAKFQLIIEIYANNNVVIHEGKMQASKAEKEKWLESVNVFRNLGEYRGWYDSSISDVKLEEGRIAR